MKISWNQNIKEDAEDLLAFLSFSEKKRWTAMLQLIEPGMKSIQPFYLEVLSSLNHNKVDYLVIGGIAVGLHGYPRYTQDLDLWLNSESSNIEKLKIAIVGLGYDSTTVEKMFAERPLNHPQPIKLYDDAEFFRVDLMTTTYQDKITWQDCKSRSLIHQISNTIEIPLIAIDDLIILKENTRRYDDSMKDLVDAEELRKIKRLKKKWNEFAKMMVLNLEGLESVF